MWAVIMSVLNQQLYPVPSCPQLKCFLVINSTVCLFHFAESILIINPQSLPFRKRSTLLSYFTGVPRIFTDAENAEILPLEQQLSHEDDSSFLEYIQTSRININIRQVF